MTSDDLGDGDSLLWALWAGKMFFQGQSLYACSRCLPIRSVRVIAHTRHKALLQLAECPAALRHTLCSAANLPDGSQVKSVGAAPVYSDEKARRLNTKPRRQGVRMDSADNGTARASKATPRPIFLLIKNPSDQGLALLEARNGRNRVQLFGVKRGPLLRDVASAAKSSTRCDEHVWRVTAVSLRH